MKQTLNIEGIVNNIEILAKRDDGKALISTLTIRQLSSICTCPYLGPIDYKDTGKMIGKPIRYSVYQTGPLWSKEEHQELSCPPLYLKHTLPVSEAHRLRRQYKNLQFAYKTLELL